MTATSITTAAGATTTKKTATITINSNIIMTQMMILFWEVPNDEACHVPPNPHKTSLLVRGVCGIWIGLHVYFLVAMNQKRISDEFDSWLPSTSANQTF